MFIVDKLITRAKLNNKYIDLSPLGIRVVASDCCLTPTQQFSSAISWPDQVNFHRDDGEVRFVLDQHTLLDFYSARSLSQQSADRHVAHLYTLSRFRANQSLLFLLNAACLAEKQQIPILQFLVGPDRGSNPRSTALDVSTLTITHTGILVDLSYLVSSLLFSC